HTGQVAAAVGGDEVVGEQAQLHAPVPAPAHRLDHGRAQLAGQQSDHVSGVDDLTGGGGLGLEQGAELIEAHLAALEAGPCVGVGVGGGEAADESVRQPVRLLV